MLHLMATGKRREMVQQKQVCQSKIRLWSTSSKHVLHLSFSNLSIMLSHCDSSLDVTIDWVRVGKIPSCLQSPLNTAFGTKPFRHEFEGTYYNHRVFL